jgi:hypothetical protein
MKTLFEGHLTKMSFNNLGSEYYIKPNYFIQSPQNLFDVNSYIGKRLTLTYAGRITCISCGKDTKKSYGQGYCYPCFISVPQTEECVLRPELCRAHEGIARDLEYAKENCLVDQIVYLALSGGLKVGVTRYHQVPNRWVDQGANKAVKLVIAKNRYTAGVIEVTLKKILADKTNWRKMLMGNDLDISLVGEKHKALEYLNHYGLEYIPADDTEYRIEYPIKEFPSKVVSTDLEKEPTFSGLLSGIKGQYLLFEGGRVINLRKHTGYQISIIEE